MDEQRGKVQKRSSKEKESKDHHRHNDLEKGESSARFNKGGERSVKLIKEEGSAGVFNRISWGHHWDHSMRGHEGELGPQRPREQGKQGSSEGGDQKG